MTPYHQIGGSKNGEEEKTPWWHIVIPIVAGVVCLIVCLVIVLLLTKHRRSRRYSLVETDRCSKLSQKISSLQQEKDSFYRPHMPDYVDPEIPLRIDPMMKGIQRLYDQDCRS